MNTEETRDSGTPHFHYDRSERLQGSGEEAKPQSYFRRNRNWLITLLDVGLLLVMFGIYKLFLAPEPATRRVAGLEFQLEAFVFDDELYLNVKVERLREPGEPTDDLVTVVFPDRDVQVDVVPAVEGDTYTFRHVMPELSEEINEATVTVSFRGEEFVLRHAVE
jgi:hypothetical protein